MRVHCVINGDFCVHCVIQESPSLFQLDGISMLPSPETLKRKIIIKNRKKHFHKSKCSQKFHWKMLNQCRL